MSAPDPVAADYCPPWVREMRCAPNAAVCIDEDCELSGAEAHVGDCEPCACPMRHAAAECPEDRTDLCAPCRGRGSFVCPYCEGAGRRRAAVARSRTVEELRARLQDECVNFRSVTVSYSIDGANAVMVGESEHDALETLLAQLEWKPR